ncbi:hypothetical protein DYB32_002313 [Aphanomyces invadans]|uniref:Uncharacterized protein n=1 Tax=Aphanomyces invadans TaxID=157072 RepID=A0A3R6WQN7_9STRA|nr:hypothetical protein DYB32_002313 [Aphanomyces invadans]
MQGARPVQVEAARVLVAVNRENKITANRVNVLLRLRKEYALGKNFWQRTLYLDACNFACDYYSHHYFRCNYLDPAIDLLEDPVPNVRLKAFALLPKWKPVLNVLNTGDDKVIGRIRSLLEATHEPDRDVLYTVHDVREAWFHDKEDKALQDLAMDKQKAAMEEAASLNGDHEMYSSEAKWSEMLEYTLIVGKDGQVVRRARVKSIDIVNKLRQQTKDMTSARGNASSASSGGNLRSTTNAAMAKAAAEKPTTKLPTTSPSSMKQQPAPLSTLPTCTPGFSQLNASAAAKMPSASGSLSAREGKGANPTTNATSLKQLADAKAAIRLNPTKAAVAPGSSCGGRPAKDKKEETTLTKIPNIPVPTRPAAAPPAKRVQSPSTTKSTALNSTNGSRTASGSASVSTANVKVTPLAKR